MSRLRIACAALTGRIYAGRPNKAGDAFLDGKVDVTSDVLKAISEHVGIGNVITVHVDGKPAFDIAVTKPDRDSARACSADVRQAA